MRLTTRQGVQFHFVHKGSLHELVNGINAAALTTLAACGDVVRNIMACPWPDERQAVLRPLVAELVRPLPPAHRRPTGSCGSTARRRSPPSRRSPIGGGDGDEPVYGDVYLPRKFKIAVAWPGDNCVDVLANDIGLVPTLSDGADR